MPGFKRIDFRTKNAHVRTEHLDLLLRIRQKYDKIEQFTR